MAEKKDLYEILGVARDADRDTIRRAYRKLARQNHPDLNPGDKAAEARFREISKAWEVLEDTQKRRNYDDFGEESLEKSFDAGRARRAREAFGFHFGLGGRPPPGAFTGEFHFSGIDDVLGGLFGLTAEEKGIRLRGTDLEAELELEFLEAIRGSEKQLTLARPKPEGGAASEILTVRVPPGIDGGGKLRVPGKGALGVGGGPPGDLWVTIRIRPHRLFRREGRNLVFDLPISVREAIQGARVEVPTLEGCVMLTIPPGTDGGTRLRLSGKGVSDPRGERPGDLLARIQIRVPRNLDEETKASLDRLARFEDPEIRKELFS